MSGCSLLKRSRSGDQVPFLGSVELVSFTSIFDRAAKIEHNNDVKSPLQTCSLPYLESRPPTIGRGRKLGRMHETLMILKHEMYIDFYGASER